MDRNGYIQYAEDFFKECIEISRKKNQDYTGDISKPFANFEAVSSLNISVTDGFLTRMMDKMKRVASITHSGEIAVKDESLKDTLQDLANYSCLLSAYLKQLNENDNCCGDWNSDGECNCKLADKNSGHDSVNLDQYGQEKSVDKT